MKPGFVLEMGMKFFSHQENREGCPFTWKRGQSNYQIWERLDRGLAYKGVVRAKPIPSRRYERWWSTLDGFTTQLHTCWESLDDSLTHILHYYNKKYIGNSH